MSAPFYASSATPEWYTPPWLVARVVAMLEGVELDPCSGPEPRTVPAERHYTRADDALSQRVWSARTLYMNPPYGRELPRWMDALARHVGNGDLGEAIALVPSRTDTRWFARVWAARAVCFLRGRVQFLSGDVDGRPARAGSTFPNVLAYYGPRVGRFVDHFADLGKIVLPGALP